jgi:hypothetical protein
MAQTQIPLPVLIGASEILGKMDDTLPLGAAVRLGRMMKAVEEWMEPFRQKQRDILAKHLNEGEDRITPEHENWEAFTSELNAMMEENADIDVQPLTVSELDTAGVKLSAAAALLLFEAGLLTD